ncbi:MAG TPA: AAA family ATPase [Candidatus Binatus sp.]|nr:AAA family ATPase [Candidatus Binatus sp.]
MTSQSTFDRQPSHNAFVGRERELAELRTGLEEASAGHGRLFLLSGEPGIGKTRLAEEISNDASARGMRVVWGRCWEGGGAPAYWPFIQILRACIADRDGEDLDALLGSGASEIARLIPELRLSLPSLEEAKAATDSESARFRLFDAVATLLKNVARIQPLLIVIDDLHDADQPSLQMLRFVARETKGAPILILGTYRDAEVRQSPELGKLIGDLIREGRPVSIPGLSQAEVGEFIERSAAKKADDKLVADLYQATDGNPLFVDGVVRLLAAEGELARTRSDGSAFKIPHGVRESIRRQLVALSEEANSLLSIASVIGNEFDAQLLERVAGRSREQVVEQTEQAVRIGVLRTRALGLAHQQFAHALIRDVLYDDLAANRRIELHRDIASAIEEAYKGDLRPHWAELARHLTEAGIEAKAIDFWIKAGEVAYSVFGFEEAASCWRTALAMTENQRTDPLVRARLLERLGNPATVGDFDPAESVEHLEAALRTYQDLGDLERAARVHTHLGHWMSTNLAAMDIPGALAHYQKAEAVLNKLPERVSLGSLYTVFGAAAREAMQTKEGLRTSSRAMQIAERFGAEALWIYAASLHSDLLLNAGRIEEALALTDKACVKADALNDAGAISAAAISACANYSQLWDPCQTESYISRELGKARLAQAPQLQERLRVWLDIAHLQKGEFKSRNRLGTSKQWDAFVQGKEKIYSGEWELAQSIAARSLAYCRRVGSRDATARSMLYAARVCLLKGQLEEGVAQLREILSMCADDLNSLCEVEALPELALVLAETARVKDAQLCLIRLREIMSAGEDWRGLAGAGARAEAVVATAEGKYEDGEAQFEKAVEIFRRYSVPFEEAEALHYWGRALNASGEQGRANKKLDAAIEIYRRCGAGERWVQRVEADRPSSPARTKKGEHPSDAHDQAIFGREGDYWTIAYEGKTARLKDAKGLHYIAHLIAHPGEEIRALDLVARIGGGGEETAEKTSAEDLSRSDTATGDLGHAGEILDAQAKAAYQRRLSELEEEIEEAREFKDEERIAKAEDEREALGRELRGAIGLAGRERRSASATERGRIAVTKAIRLSLNKIAENDASLGKLLSTTIKTGTVCAYVPDDRFPVTWRL